ncbi:MAG: tetratricopeptide repeat protein, partial [bacterium]|nr:tetratricopeptide repeat protein [bacterium]
MTYREILKRYEDSVASKKALFPLGDISFRKGLFREAAGFFSEYLEKDSLGTLADKASYYLAESFFKLGELEEAKTNYSILIENYRDSDFLIPSRLRLADIEALSGRFLDAAKLYSQLADRAPSTEREEIIWKMAGFYRKAEAFKEAHKAYRYYIDEYPESERVKDANIFLGEIDYLSGNYKKGIKRFSKIVEAKGEGDFLPENALRLAWGYIKLNQLPDALKILDLIIKKYPESRESATAYYLKGWLAQEGNRLEKANDEYRKLLKKFDDTPVEEDVKWQIGVNQFILGDYKGAIKSFQRFSKDFPDSYRPGDLMIRKSYSALGDFKGALESSPTFFDVSPDKTVDLKQRCDEAIALFEVGSHRDALKLADTIIERFPSQVYSSRVMIMAGEIYLKKGMEKKASHYFLMVKDILKVGLLRSFASFRLGELAFKSKDFRGAVMELEGISPALTAYAAALEELKVFIDPAHMMAMTLYLRGSAYLHLNHVEKALNDYRKFLDEYPLLKGLSMERLKAGLTFQQHKDYDQAIKSMRETIAIADETKIKAEAQYWIGESFQGQGDFKQAIIEFLKVTYLYPGEGMWALTAKYMAAQAYQELGQYENAIKLFEKVAKESGDKRKREYAINKVKELAKMIEPSPEVMKD